MNNNYPVLNIILDANDYEKQRSVPVKIFNEKNCTTIFDNRGLDESLECVIVRGNDDRRFYKVVDDGIFETGYPLNFVRDGENVQVHAPVWDMSWRANDFLDYPGDNYAVMETDDGNFALLCAEHNYNDGATEFVAAYIDSRSTTPRVGVFDERDDYHVIEELMVKPLNYHSTEEEVGNIDISSIPGVTPTGLNTIVSLYDKIPLLIEHTKNKRNKAINYLKSEVEELESRSEKDEALGFNEYRIKKHLENIKENEKSLSLWEELLP